MYPDRISMGVNSWWIEEDDDVFDDTVWTYKNQDWAMVMIIQGMWAMAIITRGLVSLACTHGWLLKSVYGFCNQARHDGRYCFVQPQRIWITDLLLCSNIFLNTTRKSVAKQFNLLNEISKHWVTGAGGCSVIEKSNRIVPTWYMCLYHAYSVAKYYWQLG